MPASDELIPWSAHLAPGMRPDALDLTAQGSLPAAWSKRWADHPSALVLRDPKGAWLHASDLLDQSATAAGSLAAAGARPGDRVLFAAPSSSALVMAHLGALRAGMVVVPLNPAAVRRELEAVISDAKPTVAMVADHRLAAWATQIDPELVVVAPHIQNVGGAIPPLDVVRPNDIAMLIYTSGTTGAPKGAELSHANLLAGTESVRVAWGWTDRDTLILCLPLSHVHGLGIGLHGALLAGSPVLLFDRFDPERVLQETTQATMFFGVPTMYERLVTASGCERLAHLRLCVCGSAPLSPTLHRRIEERCGQSVLERYGMTETMLTVSNPLQGERRPGTVGFPLPGVHIRLDEQTGEILVRAPSVFSGYRGQPEINQSSFTQGWFRTGDIGQIERGYLRIVGRFKDLIITGGYNVYPLEVEEVLRTYPNVRDAAVIGVPSQTWGEIVAGFVEGPENLDLEALSQHAAQELVFYKRPRLLQRVEELPRNLLGKVLKTALVPPGAPQPGHAPPVGPAP